jgi:hypothetical protein
MNVCLLTWWGDSLTYTLARALSAGGHGVHILVCDRERHLNAKWGISARIREIPDVTLELDPDAGLSTRYGMLIVQSFPRLDQQSSLVSRLAERADRVTLVSFGDRVRPWRDAVRLQRSEWRVVQPFRRKLSVVAYKDGFHRLDLFAATGVARAHVGFDVHSKFLHVDALFRRIHAADWSVGRPRNLRVNFVGSRDPRRRGDALDSVDRYLQRSGAAARDGRRVMWKVYSDAQPGALPESEFVDILSDSDFTLAPPGHSLITHRPIEAMLRGSIPILNEREAPIYELKLRDGENCLLVRDDDWAAAVARALQADRADLERMRANIMSIRETRLDYPALAAGIRGRLGVAA